jgi:proteasome accessory factor B
MASSAPLVRQWLLLRTLSTWRHGATIRELADELEVSEKTIRRDLDTFLDVGFPVRETVEDHNRKKYLIEPPGGEPGLVFAFDEALALYFARQLLEPLAGTPFWEAANRAFRKIRASLGPGALQYAQRLSGMFHQTMVGVSDYARKAELIDQLMLGIEDRRAVFITYQSLRATEPVTYDIYPYGLVYHRGSLYLVGWAPEHGEVRHWKLDRMTDAEVTEFPFEPPAEFDLQAHLSRSFGVFQGNGQVHVQVRFSAEVARYVCESRWHASQQVVAQKDGSVVADFDLDHTEEVKRWILSFGRHAEVLKPESLRNDMLDELTALRRRYEGPISKGVPTSNQ